jgi:hypothetical protein
MFDRGAFGYFFIYPKSSPISRDKLVLLRNIGRWNVLAHLHFFDSLSWVKVSLWLGSKGVARKKHRLEKNSIRRSPRASAEGGGPIGRPAGRPYNAITRFLGKERLARPTQKMNRALWFLRATPLLSGLATPEILSLLRLLGKK